MNCWELVLIFAVALTVLMLRDKKTILTVFALFVASYVGYVLLLDSLKWAG